MEDDTLVFNGGDADNTQTFDTDGNNASITGGLGEDTLTLDLDNAGPAVGGAAATDFGDATVAGGRGNADPADEDDTLTITNAGNLLAFGNAGDDVMSATGVQETATVYGGLGDDTITVTSAAGEAADLFVIGGEDEDSISVSSADGDLTVAGGTGPGTAGLPDGDDTISVSVGGEGDALVLGNLGDDSIDVTVSTGDATVFGGMGDDDISVVGTEAEDTGAFSIIGGEGSDTIAVDTTATTLIPDDPNTPDEDESGESESAAEIDVTVAGGTGGGTSGVPDDADSIGVTTAGDTLVFGNLGDDDISVSAEGGSTVFGGVGDDDIGVTQTGGEDEEAVSVFGGEDEDVISVDVELGATVSGGISTTAADSGTSGSTGDTIDADHTGGDEESFLLVGSLGDDVISFGDATTAGGGLVDGDQLVINAGGGDDVISIAGAELTVNDDGDLEFTDADGTQTISAEDDGSFEFDFAFTGGEIEVTITGFADSE